MGVGDLEIKSVLSKDKAVIPPPNGPEMMPSASDDTKSFAEFFSESSALDEWDSFLLVYSIEPNKQRGREGRVLKIRSWGLKISENLMNEGGVNFPRARKIGIFCKAKTHESKELYPLYSPHDNWYTIQDGWCIIIIAIYVYLFTYSY